MSAYSLTGTYAWLGAAAAAVAVSGAGCTESRTIDGGAGSARTCEGGRCPEEEPRCDAAICLPPRTDAGDPSEAGPASPDCRGPCDPGEVQTGGDCGRCGTRRRSCDDNCTWGPWSCVDQRPEDRAEECVCGSIESQRQQLPDSCVPRCTRSTLEQLQSCSDRQCQRQALDSDGRAPAPVRVGSQVVEVDCRACVQGAQAVCFTRSCPEAYDAFEQCRMTAADSNECTEEAEALNQCLRDNESELGTCQRELLRRCFP